MSRIFLLFIPWLLCQCAAKHQPLGRGPYFFEQPEEVFSSKQLAEMAQLELKTDLLPLEKKRLFDLYQTERKTVREGSSRAEKLDVLIQKLKPEVEPLLIASPMTDSEASKKENKEKVSFRDPEVRKEIKEAYQAWNQDENEKAILKIETVLGSPMFMEKMGSEEKLQVFKLFFRVAFDLGDLEKSDRAFKLMRAEENCSSETAQSGFLLSLLHFALNKQSEAWELLSQQCDPDTSLKNRIRKAYWLFRLAPEGSAEKTKYFDEVASSSPPGFYSYLALSQKGQILDLPLKPLEPLPVFSCSEKIERVIREAELRLEFALRKDARKLLLQAKKELLLKPESNIDALIYVARLFQSAGDHLEAMKILNALLTGDTEGEGERMESHAPKLVSEFTQLYHRPFLSEVEWACRTWGVDPDFVYSIMRQESAFNPGAVSIAGARGLMQLMPVLGKFIVDQWKIPMPQGKGYLFRGKENIRLATYHLRQLNQVAPHPALMAASYNAGIQRVTGWWKRFGHHPLDIFVEFVPIHETRNYIKLVLRNFIYYSAIRNGGPVPRSLFSMELPPSPVFMKSLSPTS